MMHSLTKSITIFPTIVEEKTEEEQLLQQYDEINNNNNNMPIMIKLPSVLAYSQKHLTVIHNINQKFFYFDLENNKYTFYIKNQKKCVDLIYFILDTLSGLNNNLLFDIHLSSFNNPKELKELLKKPLAEIIFTHGEIII